MRSPNRTIRALIFAIVVVAFMLLGCLPFLHAQSTNAIAISNQIVSPGGAPAQNAAVLVCQITAIGSPCATTGVVLYADPNLAVSITNPVSTDQYGNYAFFTTTGAYQIQVTPAGASGPTYVYYYINQTSGTGNGSVTAVGLSLPTDVFNVTGSPITTAGTLTAAFIAQAPNTFFAGPTVGPEDAAPTFRALVAADIPTGLPYVSSVGFAATPTLFTVTGQPITTSGTITLGVADQQPNYVFAGPATGTSAGAPTFRQLVTADFPTLYYQNVQINGVTLPPTSTLNFSASFASTSTSPTTAISLAPTTVTAGSYACVSATINQFGQITAASSVGCTGDNVPPNTVFAGPASGGPGPASWQVAPTFSAANLTSIPAVTNISVTPANGVSANIINSTTTPNLTFTLGAITPSMVSSTGPVTGTTLTGSLLAPYAGDCASIGTSGQITSTGSPCGSAGGGSSFSVITSGVNTGATMTVAAGATLNYSAGGILNASAIDGVAVSGTAAAGYAAVAGSSTAATWQLIPGLAAANVWTGSTNSFQALTATTITASGLSSTSGNCVQIASGGTLSSSGQPCNASPSFAALTTGTNTAAAMTIGTGASMTYAGGNSISGGVNANYFNGLTTSAFCLSSGGNCAAPTLTVNNGITYSTAGGTGTLGLGTITPTSVVASGNVQSNSGSIISGADYGSPAGIPYNGSITSAVVGFGWNATGASGEMDLWTGYGEESASNSAFNFYANTSSGYGSPLMSITRGGIIQASGGSFSSALTIGTQVSAESYMGTGSSPTCSVTYGSGTCTLSGRQSGGAMAISPTSSGLMQVSITLPYSYPNRATCVVSGSNGATAASSISDWFASSATGSTFGMENLGMVANTNVTVYYVCSGW